jgi:hypothetical protein
VKYVLENPLRARLVDRLDDYPVMGSMEYCYEKLEELLG